MKQKIQSIGVDVSKKTLDVCFLGDSNKVLTEFKTTNDAKGVQNIISRIKKHEIKGSIVMESTSSYHMFAALMLKENNYSVKVFNPIINLKYSKGSVRKCKTDKIDAKRIAEIGLLENFPEFSITKEQFFLRRKISLLNKYIKQKQAMTASYNQLKEDSEKLGKTIDKSYLAAEKAIMETGNFIGEIEKEIYEESKNIQGFNNVVEIKGISSNTASIVLGYIGNMKFETKQSLTAFAGLDVSTKQSGTSIHGKGKISKRGNKALRKALTQMAWGLRMHNDAFIKLAEYYKNKGKHYFEIMVIIARKMLHVLFGMLKTNSRFDPAKIIVPETIS